MLEAPLVFYKSLLVSYPQQQHSPSIQSWFSDPCSCPASANSSSEKEATKLACLSEVLLAHLHSWCSVLWNLSPKHGVPGSHSWVENGLYFYLPSPLRLYFRSYISRQTQPQNLGSPLLNLILSQILIR